MGHMGRGLERQVEESVLYIHGHGKEAHAEFSAGPWSDHTCATFREIILVTSGWRP